MTRFVHYDLPDWWRRWSRFLLAVFWILGLMFGVFLSFSAGGSFVSLMRLACDSPVSIIALLMTILLPFLLTALAVYVSEPRLLLIFCFLKAACFSFVSVLAFRAFASAGWLVRCLLMFADICTLPLLYGSWNRHIAGDTKLRIGDLGILSGAILACCLDYACISPFLAELFQS